METLIRDALKDFDSFKELAETIPLEVLAAEIKTLSHTQQQVFQDYERRLAAHSLAERVRECTSWEAVEEAIASNPECKNEAWTLLKGEEKERIKNLKAEAAKPIDPESDRLNGKRVFVLPGSYRISGEGIVEVDRGFGHLRVVEVRMPNHLIQPLAITDVVLA